MTTARAIVSATATGAAHAPRSADARVPDERAPRGASASSAAGAAAPVNVRSALASIVMVALVARGIGLDGGLWVDEIYSLVRSFRAPVVGILTEFWGDNHHPLYALLAHGSRALFGESAWAVRLPAMLLGVAAVPMVYLVGARLVPRREALLAALLLAVSYHHVWFSQNARGYSAIALLALVTTWALLRAVDTGATRDYALYALAAALGAYTHLTMVLVVVGHALATLVFVAAPGRPVERQAVVRGAALAFGGAAALTLLLYAPMLREVVDFFLNRPSQLRGVSTPRWALMETVRVLVLGLGAGLAIVGGIVVAAGAVVGLSGLASYWRRHRLFVLMLLAPCAVTVAGAALARGTMYPRFFFFAIGPAMLVVVRGAFATCAWLAARVGRPTLGHTVATTGVSLVALLSAASLGFNYRYPKQDFEGAMRFVLAEQRAGDAVVSTGLPADPYRMLYGQPWPNLSTQAELDSVRRGHQRTWVLWTFPRYLERHAPEIDRLLHRECSTPRVFRGTVGGGDVMVCVLPQVGAAAGAASPAGSTAGSPAGTTGRPPAGSQAPAPPQ